MELPILLSRYTWDTFKQRGMRENNIFFPETEIRELSDFNFQWTKTLYQNNLNNITFFFTFFKGYRCNSLSVITPKKISYEIEAEKINVKFSQMTPYTWNFQNFTCVFKILVKFDIYFLGLPWEIVFGVYVTDNLLCL